MMGKLSFFLMPWSCLEAMLSVYVDRIQGSMDSTTSIFEHTTFCNWFFRLKF